MRSHILGLVGSMILRDISSHINSGVLLDKSGLGFVQSDLSWSLDSRIGRKVLGGITSGIGRDVLGYGLIFLFVQELLEIGFSFSSHCDVINRGSSHGKIGGLVG